jgi:hypothetical protein
MADRTSLPYTEAMLASATDIYVVMPITTMVAGVELTIPLTAAIGTIEKLERRNNRETTRRYGLGKHAFEPLDIIPGPIKSSLSISKIVLYKDKVTFPLTQQLESLGVTKSMIDQITSNFETNGEFMGLFNMTGGNVLYQQKPIHIEVVNYDHSQNATNDDMQASLTSSGRVASVMFFWNCWITSNPITYSLQNPSDILIRQEVELDVGRIEVYEPNLSRVASSTASSIIPTSIAF